MCGGAAGRLEAHVIGWRALERNSRLEAHLD